MSGLRVAMVSEHASPLATLGGVDAGGQNVHVAALSAALVEQGHEVVVHTRRDDPGLPRQVTMPSGVVVDHVDAGPPVLLPKDALLAHMPAFAADLCRQWGVRRPDVVHAHFWMSAFAALRAAPVPVVQTFHALGVVKRRHQGAADTSPPERLAVEREVLRRADHVIATCSDEVFELLRLGGRAGAMTVVPCGVDLELFRPDGPVAPRARERRRVLMVGRLVERKGLADAVAALPQLPDVELVVAGGPPASELAGDPVATGLVDLARQLGVSGRLTVLGQVCRTELPALFRSADAVVCVPWYEPFGIVPLEAMACGRPVVASSVGGLVDTVVDGVTGRHVPPRDPGALAAALRQLLDDDALRDRLGRAGLQRARSRYSWDRIAQATARVYESVRAGRRGRLSEARL